jgi:hypothetical protein
VTLKTFKSGEAGSGYNIGVTQRDVSTRKQFVPAGTPLCLEDEKDELALRLDAVDRGAETLLVTEFVNLFSSALDFEYVVSFMLCANALAMWRTGQAVTRLLVLAGDVPTNNPDRLYAFANQFRFLMQGGYARIDKARVWMERLGVAPEFEPLDLRDFRRAVRVFSAARASPDQVRSLASAEWYFGFHAPAAVPGSGEPGAAPDSLAGAHAHDNEAGHFAYRPLGDKAVQVTCRQATSTFEFEDRFSSGQCEILSSPARGLYKLSFDLSGVRSPPPGTAMARYLDVSGLIGGGRDVE